RVPVAELLLVEVQAPRQGVPGGELLPRAVHPARRLPGAQHGVLGLREGAVAGGRPPAGHLRGPAVVPALDGADPAVLGEQPVGAEALLVDPAPPTGLPDELLRLVDVIKPNATEAEALTGVAVRDRVSAHRAAEALLDRGVRAVAVQAGNEGNLLA